MTGEARPGGLVQAIRGSLEAKLERLLRRPLIARVVRSARETVEAVAADDVPDVFRVLQAASRAAAPTSPWREEADGTFTVRIALDYDDLWRGCEREVLETVAGTVENEVTFLTEELRVLLERSPREFLDLETRPEAAELVGFTEQEIAGGVRVVALTVAAAPESEEHVTHVAIVPNLIQITRQLDALVDIAAARDDGPLAPLRALLGLGDADRLAAQAGADGEARATAGERLDEYQAECVRKALTTPHFAVIQGPPGSGKTTVIASILRRALARGQRVLVVSPTHVAVDNVVEKLVVRPEADGRDDLEKRSLPVRYAARRVKVAQSAAAYWVGPKKEARAATIARRLEACLSAALPLAAELYARRDAEASDFGPLSAAITRVHDVVCGTPIGILSFDPVKRAAHGGFDLLIVDEVSKMTLSEFLAIAVKARRWVLVGDPEQLPPFNNAEENGETLDAVLAPALELVCSVGAIVERCHPALRGGLRLVVVASAPALVAAAVRAHLAAVGVVNAPPVASLAEAAGTGVVVCTRRQVVEATGLLTPVRERDRTHRPEHVGSVDILVERGLQVARPAVASGSRLVERRMCAPAQIFENAFAVYHAQPWSARADQKLRIVGFRNGIVKYLPSTPAIEALGGGDRAVIIDAIAERFAVNAVSVYDWLTGVPSASFDASPLQELARVTGPQAGLQAAVRPYVGTLRQQYRMHPSLSLVPRVLFYFNEALVDGAPGDKSGCRVTLMQVATRTKAETNDAEVAAICKVLAALDADDAALRERPHILVITPYRAQERRLKQKIGEVAGGLANIVVEVLTLDSCQGREAAYVFISLVRAESTTFLDGPKRWNVALTRAKQGLFIVGDVEAYLREASKARGDPRTQAGGRPLMSLLARVIEAYEAQIAGRPLR